MARRSRIGRMVALAGVLLGTALGVGPGGVPAGATIGDPPTVVAVPIDDPAVLGFGLVPSVRRVFVVGADETFVVDETGAVVGTVAIGGDVIEQGNDEMVVLSVDDATITVIDIATLAPITYDLDGYDRLAGLAVANDVAWTSVLASDGTTTLLEIDLLTGATDEVATGLGAAPLQLFTLDFTGDVVAVEDDDAGPTAVWTVRTSSDDLVETGSIPGAAVEQADLTDLGDALTVVQGGAVNTYAQVGWTFVRSNPFAGTDPVLGANGTLIVASGTSGSAPVAIISSPHGPDYPQMVPLASPAAGPGGLIFHPSRRTLYVLGVDGTLQLASLTPELTRTSPRVLSPIGGTDLTLEGRGLAGALVFVESASAPIQSSSDERTVVRTRPFSHSCSCITEYAVFSVLDHGMPGSMRIAYLGPYSDGYDLADGASRDFLGDPATPAEREAVDDAVYASGDIGAPFADLSRLTAARGPRPALLRLYRSLLGRWADTAGLRYWVSAMQGGRSLSSVARALAASPEFAATYGDVTDADLVDRLYLKILGRTPEPAGRAYWIDALADGASPGRVALLFSESPEHRARTALDVDVTVLWLGMLRVVPGATPRAVAVARLRDGVSLSTIAGELVVTNTYAAAH